MSRRARARAQCLDVRVHFGAIRGFHVFRNDFHLAIGFQIDEHRRALHRRPNLLRVENVKQNDLIAVEAQRRDGVDDRSQGLRKNRR